MTSAERQALTVAVVRCRFVDGLTVSELSARHDITREHVDSICWTTQAMDRERERAEKAEARVAELEEQTLMLRAMLDEAFDEYIGSGDEPVSLHKSFTTLRDRERARAADSVGDVKTNETTKKEGPNGTVEYLDSRHGPAPQQGQPERREPHGGGHGPSAKGGGPHGDEGDDHVRRRGGRDERGPGRGDEALESADSSDGLGANGGRSGDKPERPEGDSVDAKFDAVEAEYRAHAPIELTPEQEIDRLVAARTGPGRPMVPRTSEVMNVEPQTCENSGWRLNGDDPRKDICCACGRYREAHPGLVGKRTNEAPNMLDSRGWRASELPSEAKGATADTSPQVSASQEGK